ncbi:TRAP-type mannitol/chloroaromatic compound transport system, small permease component [Nitrosomonas cryotolerans]|uniref:TRAP transporter small permease protein n=1 Tax=Nitrosomonas cryotolerans ATCC 49181 TaxID=1131553 RepID=A0A1N6FDR7_9PROT|nr:TRAP transporter small permease subunit [Nitrosomonas cryotolerans]SFQ00926.1 TRAP-type mannitol/chloroaromatic compound transport system, small permease component [Nitrosomonas cryotolerans]SIN93397.1 TRAP-type mannitol/chloroaromatic compound transport system, small permease component [Nitrosomonas cryotolerans ATCC 49181]
MKFLRKFEQAVDALSGSFGWLAGWLCILMICIVFIDVIARYLFDGGLIALQEMEWHLFAAVFLLGAAYTMREDANVRVDVFYARMTVRKKAIVDILGTVFFVIPMCSLILYSAYDFVTYSYKIQEISNDPGGLHYRFIFKALLPLGYFLVLMQSLTIISRNVRLLIENTNRELAHDRTSVHREK